MHWRIIAGLFFAACAAFAQAHGGLGRAAGGPVGGGFGSVVFPGTGVPRGNPNIGLGHIPALSNSIRGIPPGAPAAGGHYRGGGGGGYIIPGPVVVGGYGYGYGYSGYGAATPGVTVVNAPQPSPSVIINQNYSPDSARPVVRDYAGESSPTISSYQAPIPDIAAPAKPQTMQGDFSGTPTIYLIALKDGAVYSAFAAWVEGDTLHYVTTGHVLNMASLSLVDVAVSNQLNRERGVDLKLPAAN